MKYFYLIFNPLRKFYWFIFHPKTYGVKCLVEHDGKFLMIRNSYGKKHWTFPGGGVKRGEEFGHAASREALEEVGIDMDNPIYLGSYYNERQYKKDTVYCFYKKVLSNNFVLDSSEVLEVTWFSANELPSPCAPAVKDVLELYNFKNPIINGSLGNYRKL